MSDLTARMLAKADRERTFRELEEAAAQSQRDVRAGLRDEFGTATGKQPRAPRKRATSPGPRVEPDTKAIADAYQSGYTIPEIADQQSVSTHTVYRHLKLAKVPLRAKTALPDDTELVRLYESGLSIRDIAVKFAASNFPVHQRLINAGATMRTRTAARSAA